VMVDKDIVVVREANASTTTINTFRLCEVHSDQGANRRRRR
jgi:hypothetical protein